ncbi:ABC transporter permease [Paenibacillus elgii]
MTRFIIKRIGQALITMFLVCFIVFAMGRISGDPTVFILGANASDVERAELRSQLGLDQPLPIQFLSYIGGILKGDFGTSLYWKASTLNIFAQFFPMTLQLALAAVLFAAIVGIGFGLLSALKPLGMVDRMFMGLSMMGQSMPTFWLGILLIQIFSLALGWLPTSGYGSLAHLILPTVALGWFSTSSIMRITRSSMIEVLSAESIKLCRTKGLSEFQVICKHALKNALPPILAIIGVQFGYLLSGSVVTEKIFAWPGIGSLAVQSIANRDFPLLQTIVLLGSGFVLLISLLTDILYAMIDSRISYAEVKE